MPLPAHARPTTARSGKGGLGWIILAVLILAIAGSVAFAPSLWEGVAGWGRAPVDEGREPTQAKDAGGALSAKRGQGGIGTMTSPAVRTETEAPVVAQAAPQQPTTVQPQVVQAPVPTGARADDAKASAILTEAEQAFRGFQWMRARSAADRVAQLDAAPRLLSRARDIRRGSEALERLFKDLDDADELSRNYDTHPALVRIGTGASRILAVPMASDTVLIEDTQDPVLFIQMTIPAGDMWFMIQGRRDFSKTKLRADAIGEPEKVDVAQVRKERGEELALMAAKVEGDQSLSADFYRWYELGRYAYRNRLDDRCVEFLDRAVLLEPNLAAAVRNDKARILAASMMVHLRSGNKVGANAFMAAIRRKYATTDAGRMAIAEFDGKQQEMLAIARDMERKRRAEEQERMADLKRRAEEKKKAGDDAGARKLDEARKQKEAEAREEDADNAAPSTGGETTGAAPRASGDEAKADELYERGRKLCGEAVEMPAGSARSAKFRAAVDPLRQAVQLYNRLGLDAKATAANQMLFMARKNP